MLKRFFHLKIAMDTMLIFIVIMASLLVQACGSSTQTNSDAPVVVSLSSYLNNKGTGSAPGQANLDGSGYSYPANQLPKAGQGTLNGISYQFSTSRSGADDNVVALGQTINLPQGNYQQALLLVTATWGSVSGMVTIHYADGSTSSASLNVPDWLNTSGVVNTSYRYTPTGIDQEAAHIYAVQVGIDGTKIAISLTLPSTARPSPKSTQFTCVCPDSAACCARLFCQGA